ncbi:amidase [Dongia mobilis]|uniref:Amidase n=1 Tax=Dongia mobilis TaxID=578943 RepID=A0A4R6WSD2_9PROT|nr:amidase [Dongia mobilis]TDQ84552.1 amidase [Dongia mobilis]
MATSFQLVEAGIAEIRAALEAGTVTSVELVAAYLNRIAHYDRQGIRLNAVPVFNPQMFADAQASDLRRAEGRLLGPLDGVPYTAKDSYKAKGLTVASGSPAFERLVASDDAFTIAQLRAGGAVLIGLTNMPPMANGGMERGVYGRAESPYNGDFLTACFFSGSSNGSGTATAASFAAFGLGEETWSSGRAPASLNGLVAYTPSRGVISVRGNWPLIPTMDVVVPHTRTVADMLEVLDVVVADDPEPRGDFWRMQPWIDLPKSSAMRPASYQSLADAVALKGKRFGIPRMYINGKTDLPEPIETRASVIALWEQARRDLEARGAVVVEVDFPAVSNYEREGIDGTAMARRGLVPPTYFQDEFWDLAVFSWDDFLQANGDPALNRLADVAGEKIFPLPTGALPGRLAERNFASDLAEYPARAARKVPKLDEIPTLPDGLRGLERARKIDLEDWLDAEKLDGVVFPAVADVAPADSDVNPVSYDIAFRNGTWVANGNLVIRHLGIPTVTVPMGIMADTGMPVGLTFAGKAYDDANLLRYAYAFEHSGQRRQAPPRTPPLPSDRMAGMGPRRATEPAPLSLRASLVNASGDQADILVEGETTADNLRLFIDGLAVAPARNGASFTARLPVPLEKYCVMHSEWRQPYGSIVIALADDARHLPSGSYCVVGGIE